MAKQRTAILYRMALPDHVCPFGVHAKQMLESSGYEVDDRLLTTRIEVDAFKDQHRVQTTPLIFIDGDRIGGSDQLARYLSSVRATA